MHIFQTEVALPPKKRGFHLITDELVQHLQDLSKISAGTLHVFVKHTSCSLSINENCDSSVRVDFESFSNALCDNKPYLTHTHEGDDDMPAHIKSSIYGVSLNIPITNGKLNLGTWQGIYLNEHRDSGGSRKIVITAVGI